MTQFSLKFLLGLLLLLISNIVYSATLLSQVDRNPIKINQTLTLIVQYDEQINSSDLDLSGLSNNFEVLATVPSTNNSVSIVNGQTTRTSTTTWRITLAAKREGVVTIPAFNINGVSSAPINIQVNGLTAAEQAEPQPIEVTLTVEDANNPNIKTGEQVIVNIELSAAGNVSNLRGEEFALDGADIEVLGQQNGQRLENGVAREVVILRYALFPTSSGQITIPAQTFTGTIGGRRSFFDSFVSGGQQVGGRSDAQTINVEAQPAANGNTWFPANNVDIESSWSGDINQVRVGEPITRTITITANGQRANAIPPLSNSIQTDYKSYKDQPQIETTTTTQGLVGVRIESEAIVPSASGDLELPEQRISWWDNLSDQWREAILPAESMTVLAAVGGSAVAQPNNSFAPPIPTELNQQPNQADMNSQLSNKTDWWWKLATLGLALVCFLQFYLLRKQQTINPTIETKTSKNDNNEKASWNQLEQSLKQKDPRTIRTTLLIWAKSASPKQAIHSLDDVSKLSNSPTLKTELNKLDKQLYSSGDEIDVSQLTTQLNELRQEIHNNNKNKKVDAGKLASLYPV